MKLVEHQRDHHEERDPQAEFLADQIGQPLAGHRAHARAHLLRHDQQQRDGNQRPQRQIAVLRAGLRIGEDAAGVVIDVGGDESRADDRQKDRDLIAEPFQHGLAHLFPQHRDDVVGGDHAGQFALVVDHRQGQQVVLVEQLGNSILLLVHIDVNQRLGGQLLQAASRRPR